MTALTEQTKRSIDGVITEFLVDQDIPEWSHLDSLAAMDMLVEVEEAFNVSLPLSILEDNKTRGDFVNAVSRTVERRY